MLSCQHIAEYATDYVEGRMNFWQRLKFRMHLRACVHCERFIRHMGLT
ncbi:MAG: zf-HC2 domain-containing protein, partial [Porticoccaceae bacterium]|nr:zf-HC2 domain-containing protein [Porticoccaceae bacterium]